MGVIRFGIDNYLVKFDDSYSEQLYAIQGETARSYIFTLEDIKDKVLDSFNVELKMVLFVNGKAGIVKSCPLWEIYAESEKREVEEKIVGNSILEDLQDRINGLTGAEKQEALKEYENLVNLNDRERQNLKVKIEGLKEEHKDKFFLKIPQGYLQEPDKDATYQLFIVNTNSGELLAQKEGSFVVYPNRNFQGNGENLLVDFSEFKMSMDKVLEIGDNLHLVEEVVTKADEINELYELVKGMTKDKELVEFSKEKSKIYGEIGKIAGVLENTKESILSIKRELDGKLEVAKEGTISGGRYVIYSNNYCEIFVSLRIPIRISTNYYDQIWYGGHSWKFPFLFKESPIVALAEAKWSTGITWGGVRATTVKDVNFIVYNFMQGVESDTIFRFKVSGFLKDGSYINPEFV